MKLAFSPFDVFDPIYELGEIGSMKGVSLSLANSSGAMTASTMISLSIMFGASRSGPHRAIKTEKNVWGQRCLLGLAVGQKLFTSTSVNTCSFSQLRLLT